MPRNASELRARIDVPQQARLTTLAWAVRLDDVPERLFRLAGMVEALATMAMDRCDIGRDT